MLPLQIHKLLQKPSLIVRNERAGDRLEYRKLTDVPKPKEEPISDEGGVAAVVSEAQIVRLPLPDDKEISIGNSLFIPITGKQDVTTLSGKKAPPAAGRQKSQDISEQPVVIFRGSVVDIGQMLDQLQRLEVESRTAEQKCSNFEQELSKWKERSINS